MRLESASLDEPAPEGAVTTEALLRNREEGTGIVTSAFSGQCLELDVSSQRSVR